MTIKQTTYLTKLPSTGEQVKYRPFVVKEEKALLLALQEGDPFTVINSVKELVSTCTFGTVDPDKVAYFDLEYMFLMIRAKAVGETVDMIGFCECGAKTPFVAEIESALVDGLSEIKNKIEIPDTDWGVEMRFATIDDIVGEEDPETEKDAIGKAARMITSIWDQEEVFEYTLEEKVEFIESLTPKQQKPIAQFIAGSPAVKIPAVYKCKGCGKDHNTFVEGLENFFV